MDKEKKKWLLIEGTVCGVGLISNRWKTKQDKYRELRAGIRHQYPDYKVNQVNVVFYFLAEYHQSLKNDLNEHLTGKNEEEAQYLIMKSQKWITSKFSGDSTGFEPMTSAMPVRIPLSHLKKKFRFMRQLLKIVQQRARIISTLDFKHRTSYNISFIRHSFHGKTWAQQIDLLSSVWLPSLVG